MVFVDSELRTFGVVKQTRERPRILIILSFCIFYFTVVTIPHNRYGFLLVSYSYSNFVRRGP